MSPNEPISIPEPLQEEVRRIEGLGYEVSKVEDGVVELKKWNPPSFGCVFLFILPFLWPVAIANLMMGNRYKAYVYEEDGEIVVKSR